MDTYYGGGGFEFYAATIVLGLDSQLPSSDPQAVSASVGKGGIEDQRNNAPQSQWWFLFLDRGVNCPLNSDLDEIRLFYLIFCLDF